MTRRKENPLSRSECGRRGGLATAESPNQWSPFRHMDEDWKEAVGRKGGLECERRHIGASHADYGWARTPDGHWVEDAKKAYYQGFDAERARMKTGD